jgi:hypothetical protein
MPLYDRVNNRCEVVSSKKRLHINVCVDKLRNQTPEIGRRKNDNMMGIEKVNGLRKYLPHGA